MLVWGVRDMIGIDETGNRYGSLTVLKKEDSGYRKKGWKTGSSWICICDCGRTNSKPITGYGLRTGSRTQCNHCSNEARRVPESVQRLRRREADAARRKDPEYQAKRKEYDSNYNKNPEVIERRRLRHSSRKYKEEGRVRRFGKYGLTEEGFFQLLSKQEGKCAICGFEFTKEMSVVDNPNKAEKPHIDHCHTSGNVRGLLCINCNAGLGQFKDDPQRLQSAIQYLT